MGLRDTLGRALVGDELATMQTALRERGDNLELLAERLLELEGRLETQGWVSLSGYGDKEFSRDELREINKWARLYWLKNPLIKRAVATQTQYVFGQGMNIEGRHPLVDEVVQAWRDDPKNQTELTSHQAQMIKETELQVFGNLFFVFFPDKATGRVRVRTIPCDEVDAIICNPEDAKEPWYYKRTWQQAKVGVDGQQLAAESKTAYYPDWRYNPKGAKVTAFGSHPVEWDSPVYHVKVNALSDMRFGVSEIYAAFDWAKAYTEFLSNWATLVRAYARFAFGLSVQGGPAGVAAAKAKLGTTMTSSGVETNPPPLTASTFIAAEGHKLDVIRTSGATTKAEDGRYLRLMVTAATGIFPHYLGDPENANLATATAMERPMELMFRDRQTLWVDVFQDIVQFVIDQSAKALKGKLPGGVAKDEYGDEVVVLGNDTENEDPEARDKPIDRHVDISFPPMLEKDVDVTVRAIVSAATLDGKPLAGTVDLKTLTRMLLVALGEPDVDELLEQLFPEEEQPADGQEPPAEEEPEETSFVGALRALRAELQRLRG